MLITQSSEPAMDYPPLLDSPAINMRRLTSLQPSGTLFPSQRGTCLSELARAKLSRIKEPEESFKRLETAASSVREPNEETINPLSSFRTSWDPKSLQTHQTQFMSLASMSFPITRDDSPKQSRFQPPSVQQQFSSPSIKARFADPGIHKDEYDLGRIKLKSAISKFDAQSQANSTFGTEDLQILKDQASTFKRRIEKIECEYASVLRSVEGLLNKNFNLQQQRDKMSTSQNFACDYSKHAVSSIPVVNLSIASEYPPAHSRNSTISHLDLPSENGHDPASLALMEWAYLSFAHRLISSDDPEIDLLLSRISRLLKAA